MLLFLEHFEKKDRNALGGSIEDIYNIGVIGSSRWV